MPDSQYGSTSFQVVSEEGPDEPETYDEEALAPDSDRSVRSSFLWERPRTALRVRWTVESTTDIYDSLVALARAKGTDTLYLGDGRQLANMILQAPKRRLWFVQKDPDGTIREAYYQYDLEFIEGEA